MNPEARPTIGELEAGFWGAVCAALAHDMNNVLATTAEAAGLQTDLLSLSRDGRPIDGERIAEIASRIEGQTERGRIQTSLLSALAHSVDVNDASLDLGEHLHRAVALCERAARLREVELESRAPATKTLLRGRSFDLLHLLYRGLDLSLTSAAPGTHLTLTSESGPEGATITFAVGFAGRERDPSSPRLTGLADLAEQMGGRVVPGSSNAASSTAVFLPRSLARRRTR